MESACAGCDCGSLAECPMYCSPNRHSSPYPSVFSHSQHEYAHATTKRFFRNLPKDDTSYSPVYQELATVLSGPLSHIPQGIFWLCLYSKLTARGGDNNDTSYFSLPTGSALDFLMVDMDNLKEGGAMAFMSILAMQATVMNVIMLTLNLVIPVHPFPGARALLASFVLMGATVSTASLVTAACGIFVGLAVFWTGVLIWLLHYTILALCLAVLASFVMFSAVRLLRMTLCGTMVQEHILFQQSCYTTRCRGGEQGEQHHRQEQERTSSTCSHDDHVTP